MQVRGTLPEAYAGMKSSRKPAPKPARTTSPLGRLAAAATAPIPGPKKSAPPAAPFKKKKPVKKAAAKAEPMEPSVGPGAGSFRVSRAPRRIKAPLSIAARRSMSHALADNDGDE
jgi:hypothetical protein